MNILPKKRWHVRTRENIARVRRDEAKAAEEEKQKQLRIEKAEREARLEVLRKKAKNHCEPENIKQRGLNIKPQENDHINLFYEIEQDVVTDKSNPEYEKEKKLEREKYEKQIGYLTYLGQDTNEITGNVSWYNRDPEDRKLVVEEVAKEAKLLEDPLRDIRKYLGSESIQKIKPKIEPEKITGEKTEVVESLSDYSFLHGIKKEKKKLKKDKKNKKKKKRKRKYSSNSDTSDSDEIEVKKRKANLEKLRAERLKREMEERKRAEALFKSLKGESIKEEKVDAEVEQKYSSQFNPHLAKQNMVKK